MPARIVYMGSPDFAVPALRTLHRRSDLGSVVAVVSQPDKPTGRGQKLLPPPVKAAALELGIHEVFQPASLKNEEAQARLRSYQADLYVVAAYGKLLPQAVLDLPRLGCVNLHASLLPKYRGAAPIAHALLNGESETGICLMKMEAGLDTGPVFARLATAITPSEDAGVLTDRMANLAAELLDRQLGALLAGDLVAEPQAGEASYASKIDKAAGAIDWQQPAPKIHQHVRAYSPWPSAFTFLDGKRLQIASVEPAFEHDLAPGELVWRERRLVVGCGSGSLTVLTLKPEGKKVMSAVEWKNGAKLPARLGQNPAN